MTLNWLLEYRSLSELPYKDRDVAKVFSEYDLRVFKGVWVMV